MAKLGKNFIAALDIGCSKTVCLIAEIDPNGVPHVMGIGHQISDGIKGGTITDLKKASQTIRHAVGAAEEMAEVNVDKVHINISGNQQKSHHIRIEMPLSGQEITQREVYHLVEQAYVPFQQQQQDIVHCIPLEYTLDGTANIQNPIGMYGNTLAATFHIVSAPSSHIFNLANCLAKCHLDIDDYITSAYASSLACLNQDEKKLGVILIDFGGGNTSIAYHKHGVLHHVDSIPVGGNHVTNDIALGLNVSISTAERLKTLYGSAISSSTDEQEMIDLPYEETKDNDLLNIRRADLVNIIAPRIEETIEMVKKRIQKANINLHGNRMVITGGASQLAGLKSYLEQQCQCSVYVGVPKSMDGLAESTKGVSFSTSIGILESAVEKLNGLSQDHGKQRLSPLTRFFKWLKENF